MRIIKYEEDVKEEGEEAEEEDEQDRKGLCAQGNFNSGSFYFSSACRVAKVRNGRSAINLATVNESTVVEEKRFLCLQLINYF